MFGLYFNAICPNCNQEHPVSLGACTGYYKVNDYDIEYTPYTCPLCDKPYWLAHDFNGATNTKKRNESDKFEMTCVTCW